jgi:hypothetical protein
MVDNPIGITPVYWAGQNQTLSAEEKTAKEPELKAAEEKLEKLDRILANIKSGWTIRVYRASPAWCKGHLEQIDFDEGDDPIDLDYLARTWGGEVLRLRVSDERGKYQGNATIQLASYPPRRFGKLLKDPTIEPEIQTSMNSLSGIESLLSIVDRIRQNETLPILKLLLNQQQQAAQPINTGMQQVLETATMFKQLKGIFGESTENEKPVNSGTILDTVNSILGAYAQIKKTNPVPQSTIVPPLSPRPQLGFPNPLPIPEKAKGFVDQLTAMHPKDLAENFILAVGNMPEDKRNTVMSTLLNTLGLNTQNKSDVEEDNFEEGEEDGEGEYGFDDDEEEDQNNPDEPDQA